MGLLSIFQRNKPAAAMPSKPGRGGKSAARQAPLSNSQNPADTAEAVREARARARRRLMGATVLLLVGVIGFPLLFETQPRPIPVDLPIEIPARNAPGVVDATATARPHGGASTVTGPDADVSASALAASSAAPESVTYDTRPAASAPVATRVGDASASAVLSASSVASAKPTPVAHVAAPVPAPVRPAAPPSLSPLALLAGAPATRPSDPAAAAAGRFVVQVGAFADDAKIREVRAKVEKIGLKTYTQQVDTPGGRRVRVRVGPYATKAEADRVATKIKADGLPAAAVLAL